MIEQGFEHKNVKKRCKLAKLKFYSSFERVEIGNSKKGDKSI